MIWINVQGSQSCKSEENGVIEGKSMDRRTFLSRVLIGGTATMSPTWSAAQGDTMFPGILLVDGVTLRTPASGLFSFLDPIISQNVPVCIAVRADHENLQEPEAGADLMRLLSTLITDYPGLVDLALELPDLALRHPYLRMRDASEARNWFRRSLLAATGQDAPAAVPETIVTRLPDGEIPVIEGLRSAGILNSILLPEDGTTPEIWRNSDATQQINGGWRLPPSPSGEDLLAAFSRAASNDAPTVFAAAFPNDPLIGDKNLFDQGSVIGDAFSRNLISGRSYLILPSELRFRSGEVFARHLVLCIRADDYGAAKDSLGARFTAAGMPFTEIGGSLVAAQQEAGAASTTIAKDTRHGCVVVSGAGGGGWNEARGLAFGSLAKDAERGAGGIAACAALDVSDDNASLEGQQAGFDVVLDLSKREGQPVGFDDHGSLRVHVSLVLEGRMAGQSAQAMRKSIEDAGSARADIIVLINGKGFSEPDAASALVEALSGLGKTGQFDLLDLPQYLAAVSVKSEQARLLRVASRWPARPYVNDIDTAERDLLMEDARLAWSYFEQLTDPKTGLVPATAWIEGDQVQAYQYSTMWDTGSLILGILSAHSIGLLTATQFYERIDAVLRGLATGVFDGLRLPKGLTSTDGRATGNDEYNASDTARLLVSLHLLRSYSKKDLGVAGIVERWDLAKTIRDGIPLTVSGGSLVSSYRSNYAGYIERAFRIWGYPVTSPYSDPGPGSPFDRGVHILHEVADFGPVGTEPHLLEAVELGASDLARAASDALFAAQVEEYRSTGKLVCVSEGPVNRAPWFVYQGFQIGDDKVDWTVETLDPSPIFQTKGFIRAVDMLNSKAAFLWNSCRPGDYSDLLIAQIREKAKVSSLGFSPGVFATTGKPDQAYSDINTNGVILQAIAYRLIGGKPGVDWTWKV